MKREDTTAYINAAVRLKALRRRLNLEAKVRSQALSATIRELELRSLGHIKQPVSKEIIEGENWIACGDSIEQRNEVVRRWPERWLGKSQREVLNFVFWEGFV